MKTVVAVETGVARRGTISRRIALLLVAALALPAARGIIFYSTGDATYNTTAPSPALAANGWNAVVVWATCQGVAVSPNQFLTAQHIGGTVGNAAVQNGISYTTTKFHDDPTSDLRIVDINGTFPNWVDIYRSTDEVGKGLVVIGSGDGRGNAVTTAQGQTAGWGWGAGRGTLRWGQNTVTSAVNGGTTWGPLLYATFDPNAGANECHLASGDSGGPVFLNDGVAWKVAGVSAAVDGPFSTSSTGSNPFNAALFDARGFYYSNNGTWTLISGPTPVPTGFYCSRVSSHTAWIDTIVSPATDTPAVPPAGIAVLALALAGSGVRFMRRKSDGSAAAPS